VKNIELDELDPPPYVSWRLYFIGYADIEKLVQRAYKAPKRL
jgi:hypothetical protein